MKPIRVLQVVTIMNRGGLETMLMNYYRQMDRTRIQFDFMVHREEEGDYDDQIRKLGGNIYQMPSIKPGNYRRYFKELKQFFKVHSEYKVVHSHINENSSFVLRAAQKAGIPGRIAHSHTSNLGIDLKFPFRHYARSKFRDTPSDYFACSINAGKWLFGQKIIDKKRLTILNNAVNVDELRFNETMRKNVRKKLGLTDGSLVVGHIGRFYKGKNQDFLIEIMEAFREKNLDVHLLMVGDGPLRPSIERKVLEKGLTDQVHLLGIRSDIPQLLQAMDLFLFPSLFEGLPLVLIEAQAAGLNCIVSDTITQESDVTGRMTYLSLNKPIQEWVKVILETSPSHENTTHLLKKAGYDTKTMAHWLSRYYSSYYGLPYHASYGSGGE